ncbi:MAG: response regulator [Candidatus Cloacimonetes bacterium]|nr:response regulator [Candidatus Cloacimonadota bacterium]
MSDILVIEDNEANLYLIRYILEKNGHEVIVARNGLTGVEIALSEQPDLVVMDVQLPDINGLEATRRIRSDRRGNNLTIVALTSYAMTGDREKALAAGCTGYMEKPINPESFMKEIGRFIE